MKKILFDFITFEDKYINGGNLYVKTVLRTILNKQSVQIYGLCNEFENLNSEIRQIIEDYNIKLITTTKKWIDKVNDENFDSFFIGIAQRYNTFDLQKIKCKIFIVCHDIGDICRYKAKNLYNYEAIYNIFKAENRKFSKLRCFKIMLKKFLFEKSFLGFSADNSKMINQFGYSNFRNLIAQTNVYLITVSEYSKSAIEYYFEKIANPIKVFYPPIVNRLTDKISDKLKTICENKKYFLFVSANRESKNFIIFQKVFNKFNSKFENQFNAIVVGLSEHNTENNMYYLAKANDAELEYLMANAYCLVYSSLSEGFGYPPIEAMHHGTPVLAAFDTSIPEICGKDVLYFNPQYEEDLYLKSIQMVNNYEKYVSVAKINAENVEAKQRSDLANLVAYILE